MNKREFLAGGMAAVAAVPVLAQPAGEGAAAQRLGALLARTRRLPDLVERPGADAFEAYVGERFTVVGGPGVGEAWRVSGVTRAVGCAATEQFTVAFEPADAHAASPRPDATRVLMHATGQRLALHLERSRAGLAAHFNLLGPVHTQSVPA